MMRGLQMVQRADEWYQEQLSHVQDRMRNLGKIGGGQDNPGSTEAARERLLFQNARYSSHQIDIKQTKSSSLLLGSMKSIST